MYTVSIACVVHVYTCIKGRPDSAFCQPVGTASIKLVENAAWQPMLGVSSPVASVPGLPCYVRILICGGGNNAVNLKRGRPGLTDHVMGMRRGSSLEPRRKPGASYGKETRNRGLCLRWATWPYACTSPSVGNACIALHISDHRVYPSHDQSAQTFPVFTALFPPPQIKMRTYMYVTGKAWDRG